MPLSRHSVGNELTRNLSGNIRPQSSQLAETLWSDPSIKSGINLRELISTLRRKEKKEKKAQAGNEWLDILLKTLANEEKATTTIAKQTRSHHK